MDLKSIYDMSTRELRKEIRRRTAEANIRIAEYREAIQKGTQQASKFIESVIERLKQASAGYNKKGEYTVPKGQRGEVGVGTSYKRKVELQKQLAGLRRFEKVDIETPKGESEWSDKVNNQYKTFVSRYGNISPDDYVDMVDTMNIVKNTLKDYGYEDNGTGYARLYNKAKGQGKKKFARYVEQARNDIMNDSTRKTRTAEDILDRVADLLRDSNELNE